MAGTQETPRGRGRSPSGDVRPLRLIVRFGIYAGVLLVLAGVAVFWLVQRDVTRRAEKAIETQAQQVAEATLSRGLRRSDFEHRVSARRRKELDELFRDGAFMVGVVRGSLVNTQGDVTYTTDGFRAGDLRALDLSAILAGRSTREVATIETPSGTKKVLRTTVPVRPAGGNRPLGAVSLSQDYASLAIGTDYARGRLALILFLALLALYASLFPILRRMTAQLEGRNRRLSVR